MDGKTIKVKTFGRGGHKQEGRIVEPRWKFKQYGQCGKWVSDLFPHLTRHVDDIAFIHSMTADSPIHGSAMLMMNSGKILSGSPCIGSWVNYALGTANENLPGFVVMLDPSGGPISGPKNWSSGYMPATYQATVMRSQGPPILDLNAPPGVSRQMQREMLDTLRAYNEQHQTTRVDNTDLAARIASYELAYKMQAAAPEAVDLNRETKQTLALYGLDDKKTNVFGRQCLLARRLVERGVRFVQIYSGGNHNDANWDAHGDLVKNHSWHAGNTDQPIAALIKDLKQRDLLDETLIVWGGEFGRTVFGQGDVNNKKKHGRDHHGRCFTIWMAGGGIKPGTTYGETDDFCYNIAKDPVHVHDFQATLMHLLGIDHERLTFKYQGRHYRLTDVHGTVVKGILA